MGGRGRVYREMKIIIKSMRIFYLRRVSKVVRSEGYT